jgi:hypothetical protein
MQTPVSTTTYDAMRPEYLHALEWARWNHWLLAMWIVPAVMLCLAARSWKISLPVLPLAIVVCWWFLFLGVEYYWDVKGRIAVTEAEQEDFTSDAGRLYGPILVGVPFAIEYCCLWCAGSLAVTGTLALVRRYRGKLSPAKKG